MAIDVKEIRWLKAKDLSAMLRKKEISSKELVELAFKNIEQDDQKLNAFLSTCHDRALKVADEVDHRISRGETLPPLAGIPIAIKDNILIKDLKATCGSKILENFVSPYNATVIDKINNNFIPVIGKTNLDEFAMGSSTENSAFQTSKNPWNTSKVPGGSSGGSAVAVASGIVPLALGSDTGGSIRQPASLCGIVGLKTTYGLVSRFGLVAFGSSLDQIGPMTRSVEDAAHLLQVISGYDSHDSTSINKELPNYVSALGRDIKGLKIGVVTDLMGDGLDADTRNTLENAIKTYESLGAEISEVSIPHTKYAIATYYIVAPAEASSNLARFDGVRYGYRDKNQKDLLSMYKQTREAGFGAEVKRRIMLGTYALSAGYYDAYYKKAQQVRNLIREDYNKAFSKVDILLGPTSPTTAFDIGSKTDDPLSMYLTDIATITANLAGIPAISIPAGFDHTGLPIGIQLWSKPLDEPMLLKAAYAFEQQVKIDKKPNF